MSKRFSPLALQALKEALTHVFWYKKDLLNFLKNSLQNKQVLTAANCDLSLSKRDIVGNLIDYLTIDQNHNIGNIRLLIKDTCEFNSFAHLESLEDGVTKSNKAKIAINELRKMVEDNDTIKKEHDKVQERRKQALETATNLKENQERLAEIKHQYSILVTSSSPQKRGILLEKLMYDLFNLYELDAKAAFNICGEQIDGAFTLDNTEYIFEAKWQQEPVPRYELDAFQAKIGRKLDNTLGLFLSINTFSKNAIDIYSTTGSKFILMTGADLMSVLDERIDFITLIQRKKRHAATTGKVLLQFNEF